MGSGDKVPVAAERDVARVARRSLLAAVAAGRDTSWATTTSTSCDPEPGWRRPSPGRWSAAGPAAGWPRGR